MKMGKPDYVANGGVLSALTQGQPTDLGEIVDMDFGDKGKDRIVEEYGDREGVRVAIGMTGQDTLQAFAYKPFE